MNGKVSGMALKASPENTIFALDIGTRTVIGLVAIPEDGRLRLVAQRLVEHQRRTMLDGQIHDIPGVARAVKTVKEELEGELGFPLRQVAIAAAGRSLITRSCHIEQETGGREIGWPEVNALELAAIQQAHRELEADPNLHAGEFACVGYSILSYYLDGYPISSLIGHRGKTIGADVLATFLPDSVVNSLYAVLQRVELEPLSLTLEPIAAIEAAIPENYRLLNLALVDIGAGTSDIAITRDGAIAAYGMVPVAGDEITEEIVQSCLVDFDTAERMKRELVRGGDIHYTDIVGLESTISCQELLDRIDPALERLAREISAQILAQNGGRPPRSVFCVGGGSQVPGLTEKIARELELDKKRVVLRNRRSIGQVLAVEGEDRIPGPEGVTVAGIALVALRKLGHDFIHIMVNGVEHRLFNAREFTVGNVLALTGFNPRLLIGHNGKNLAFTLNGRRQVIFGGLSRPARILVNDREANMQTRVSHGDRIVVHPAVNGADARATAGDLLPPGETITVYVSDRPVKMAACCLINGQAAEPSREIPPDSEVEICAAKPLGEWLAEELGVPAAELGRYEVLVNGRAVSPDYRLHDGDRVNCRHREEDRRRPPADPATFKPGPEAPAAGESRNNQDAAETLATDPETTGEISGPAPARGITVMVNGRAVTLTGRSSYIFIDIFNYIDLDLEGLKPPVCLTLNGKEASFTDELHDGDIIEIGTSNRKAGSHGL
ncbi:cell division protein FtsA [Desulfofundulus australicus DSM 11792]|uniref:Cell division protein FtsA n=1 Tax=Desulfofundulus australicus DSM 11792 TaxID=1121425 RepID=A0A1M4TEV6_9FIRM|nr:cell division FtsA domain-containing protein [Desulfofundulus australicus]SHE42915.1 cell division protein FtsA [Desulfofundulus australicus DSM 11792]